MKQTNSRWLNHNDGQLISENRTLICKQCGDEQTFATKYSYRRAMGISQNPSDLSNCKIENAGLCGKCRKSRNNRNHPFKNMSKEKLEEKKLQGYNDYYNTNFKTLNEFQQWYSKGDPTITTRSYKNYRKAVERMSRAQLKVHRPKEYRRYMNNKWDGTDVNQLSIDHIKELWECYKDGLSREEASHIDNLQVITMKENINKHHNRKVI